ncbi:DUF6946 family protein [Neobacillus sp. SAB-20_R2A]|uniref:DUF6946 family protein n=1 Tax=Neobacillus sp. SAB-20_R2A TaxID=3120519 RepID=UPI003C6E24D6
MGKYFVRSKGPRTWKESLANPENQWRKGYSAYELAHSWEAAADFPSCVKQVFQQSQIPLFQKVEMLFGLPEHKVSLPGGSKESQNDLFVLAKANDELMTMMIEGKVSEPFGETVEAWKGPAPSEGKRKRLDYLLELLQLDEANVLNKRYQLLHRTASALMEAKKFTAKNALMLVHSFSESGKGYEDYAEFVELFHLLPRKDDVVGPVALQGINLYFGWVTGETTPVNDNYYLIKKKQGSH